MKSIANTLAWSVTAAVVLMAALRPDTPGAGVVFQGPLACVGLGLIGLGLCMNARRAIAARAA